MLLKGALILDCSILLPGPFVGKLLAHQGAKVLKIENPIRPDPARKMVPFYKDLNSCKELVLLDTTTTEGRSEFEKLVKKADGLIEGFRPKAKQKLGFDEKTLHAINPKLCI
ncbi:CoA transferase, partial [Bdellovibrionota bacterium FG-2]